jgi:hypothetical protein
MFLKVKKIVGVSAAVVLIVATFAWGVLENTYVNYPRSPNPQECYVLFRWMSKWWEFWHDSNVWRIRAKSLRGLCRENIGYRE